MRITTLLGSAKKKGNTATVLGWVEKELETLGHSVERIYLQNKTIGGCMGCAKCRQTPDAIACVQKDDAPAILERMMASDVVLYASPVYFWEFTSQIKRLIDRSYALVTNYHQPGHTSLMADKKIGLLATGGGRMRTMRKGCSPRSTGLLVFCWPGKKGSCTWADAAFRPNCRKRSRSRQGGWPGRWSHRSCLSRNGQFARYLCCTKNLLLGISTICLWINFLCASISTQLAYFWMGTDMAKKGGRGPLF